MGKAERKARKQREDWWLGPLDPRQEEVQTSIAQAPHYDYGDAPVAGSAYWAGHEQSPIPGRGVQLDQHQTFYAERVIDKKLPESLDANEFIDNIESRFLDELYGTDRDPETDGAVADPDVDTTTWGLDIRRVIPSSDLDVRSDEFYSHLTRGDVNWASYRDDLRYQAAFKALGYDIKALGGDTVASIQQIRHANTQLAGDTFLHYHDTDAWKRHWEGKYDPDKIVRQGDDLYIDGDRQETLSEKYAAGGGRLDITRKDVRNILGKGFSPLAEVQKRKTQVVKPDLKINKVSVKRPANIPASWGPVKK